MSSPRNARSPSGHAEASGTRGSASPYQSSSPDSGGSLSSVIGRRLSCVCSGDVGRAVLGGDAEELEDRALDREPRREPELAARAGAVGDAQVQQEVEEARWRADEL